MCWRFFGCFSGSRCVFSGGDNNSADAVSEKRQRDRVASAFAGETSPEGAELVLGAAGKIDPENAETVLAAAGETDREVVESVRSPWIR